MQSGLGKTKNWILQYEEGKTGINPLMGWESSSNMLSEIKLEFSSKENAIKYAKRNKIEYELIESNNKKIIKKSYSDNFTN